MQVRSPTALAHSIKFCKDDTPRDLVTTWRFLSLPEQVACYTIDRTSIPLGAVVYTGLWGDTRRQMTLTATKFT